MKKGIIRSIVLWILVACGVVLAMAWYYLVRDYGSYFQERRGDFAAATLIPDSADRVTVKSWLTIRNSEGFTVECGIVTPQAEGKRYPVIILLGGKATGKHAVDYAPPMQGIIIVAVDYPYTPREAYTITNFLTDVPVIRKALIDMIPSVMLVTDYLLTRKDVDTSKIILVGYSFGAPFVPCIIAHDRRAAVAAIVYGGGDVHSLIVHNVRRYENEAMSQFVGALGGLLLRPVEPMRYVAQIAPTPLIMINGTGDEQIPRANAELLYNAAGAPKTIRWLESRHVRPDNPELTKQIMKVLKTELEERGVLEKGTLPGGQE